MHNRGRCHQRFQGQQVSWRLFLDDERWPKEPLDWTIARSSFDAIKECEDRKSLPQEIAFDHDLGGDDTAMRFIYWMIGTLLDKKFTFPEGFTYSVHSQNPIGVQNIEGLMNNLLRELNVCK